MAHTANATTTRPPFRHRRLSQADGSSLVLRADGTIAAHAADGTLEQLWLEDEPGWAARAIRFGIRPRTTTVKPGRPDPVTRPADR